MRSVDSQLSFEVRPHEDLDPDDALLIGALKIKGSFRVPRDLHTGEQLLVVVQDPDGQVICTSEAEVASPGFKTIKGQGKPIGTERIHTAELVDR